VIGIVPTRRRCRTARHGGTRWARDGPDSQDAVLQALQPMLSATATPALGNQPHGGIRHPRRTWVASPGRVINAPGAAVTETAGSHSQPLVVVKSVSATPETTIARRPR
jgi:hypothetical protein